MWEAQYLFVPQGEKLVCLCYKTILLMKCNLSQHFHKQHKAKYATVGLKEKHQLVEEMNSYLVFSLGVDESTNNMDTNVIHFHAKCKEPLHSQ